MNDRTRKGAEAEFQLFYLKALSVRPYCPRGARHPPRCPNADVMSSLPRLTGLRLVEDTSQVLFVSPLLPACCRPHSMGPTCSGRSAVMTGSLLPRSPSAPATKRIFLAANWVVSPDAPQLPRSARTEGRLQARQLCAPSPAPPLCPRGWLCPTRTCRGTWTFRSLGCCVYCHHRLGRPSRPPASATGRTSSPVLPGSLLPPGKPTTPLHATGCASASCLGAPVHVLQLRDTREPAARGAGWFQGRYDDDFQRFEESSACTVMASL